MARGPSEQAAEYNDAFTEDDGAVDADNDDDDDEPSSWKKLGMSKLFGKKKTIRRKKYTKTASNSGGAAVKGGDAGVPDADGRDSDGHEMDSSINTQKSNSPDGQIANGNGNGNGKQRRHPRQRAKVAMSAAKYLDNSESDYNTDRGLEPLDGKMEGALPQRRQTQRSKSNNPSRRPDPPTATIPSGHRQRRKKRGGGDGYENSGHETSDFMFTEDEKSDFYFVTEDDRDKDDQNDDADEVEDDDLMNILLAAQKLSLGPSDDSNKQPAVEGEQSSKNDKEKKPISSDEKPPQPQPQENNTTPSKPKKKRGPRKRTPKSKKAAPPTVPEVPSMSMQQEEELDCHTPMKTTLQQQEQQQTPKRPKQQKASNNQQKQDAIDEVEPHDQHEDEDDYPVSMMVTTPSKKEDEGDQKSNSQPKKFIEEEMTFLKMHQQPKREFEEELAFLKRISPTRYQVQIGFVPNMKVPADIIVNNDLETLLVQELRDSCCGPNSEAGASFIPALRQAANVAALPGIVRSSLAMPDVHSGYGFCIGNVAAFDMDDPLAVISPGGVGFDINCGVRLIRTNLTESDVGETVREELAEALFRNIPVGVGAGGDIPCDREELDKLLEEGINWAIEKGYAWKEDRDHCEENGKMETADPKFVSNRAKKRGLKQLGTLGAGNHYAEIQVVDEIYHPEAAKTMGIGKVGQVCIMIHTGSRGLGHQVATDALTVMERAMARDNIDLNDRQLSCARIKSREGKEYLAAMSAAANFAWVNRSCITYLTRKAFSEVFDREPEDMDMHLVYDVCHNIAKVERHVVDGAEKTLLVHRKGSTRAFPPNHPNIPKDYQSIGQPVLIGGTMGTCSYVLVGTEKGMTETFGSTCHGAGRALSRNQSRKTLDHDQVLEQLRKKGISIRVASPKLVTEEAPESYKDVCDVIETCQDAGISKKVVKLRPIAVIKG